LAPLQGIEPRLPRS